MWPGGAEKPVCCQGPGGHGCQASASWQEVREGACQRARRGDELEERDQVRRCRLWAWGWSSAGEAQLPTPGAAVGGGEGLVWPEPVGVLPTKHSPVLRGCSVWVRSLSCAHFRHAAAATRASQEACTGNSRDREMAAQPGGGGLLSPSPWLSSAPFPAHCGKMQERAQSLKWVQSAWLPPCRSVATPPCPGSS